MSGKLQVAKLSLSASQLMNKLLMEFPKELAQSKFVYVYFFHEYALKTTNNEHTYLTFKPLRIEYVKKGKVQLLTDDDDVQEKLGYQGICFETNKKNSKGVEDKSKNINTDSKINVMQILTKEEQFTKPANQWSVSDEPEIIKYHKFRITVPTQDVSELEQLYDSEEMFEPTDPDFDDEDSS